MRAGMTHLSRDIRASSTEFLSFLIMAAGSELVSSAGGWYQTLECFITVLGWKSVDASRWSSNKASFGGDVKSTARIMHVLSEFLQVGLLFEDASTSGPRLQALNFPLWHTDSLLLPTKSNAYAHLNLFGTPKDEGNSMLDDREDRLQVFVKHFQAFILAGIDAAKREGGELGRASGLLAKTLALALSV